MVYIKHNWPKNSIKANLKQVEKLWEEQYRNKALALSPTMLYTTAQHQPEKEKELDVFDQLGQDLNRYLQPSRLHQPTNLKRYLRPSSRDEYQDYINQLPYDIGEMIALRWWGLEPQRIRYPRLSLMAFDILLVPAMSDEPERVFLGARRTITWDKA